MAGHNKEKAFLVVLLYLRMFTTSSSRRAQAGTYGTDFFFTLPEPLGGSIFLSVMSVTNHTTSFTIEIPGTESGINGTVEPFQVSNKTVKESREDNCNQIKYLSLRIRSDFNVSVTAVTQNHSVMFNVFQVIPVASLGEEYYVPLITNPWNGVATVSALQAEETNVIISFSRSVSCNDIDLHHGTNLRKKLTSYQAYHIKVPTTGDVDERLVVMHVQSDRPVSVICGFVCARHSPNRHDTWDYMAEQFPPFNQWGRIFTVPSFTESRKISRLVIAGRVSTSVTLSNGTEFILNSGEHSLRTFTSGDDVETIESDKPVLVVLLVSPESEQEDSSIAFVPPHEQFVHGQQQIFIYGESQNSVRNPLAVIAACESMISFEVDRRIFPSNVPQKRAPGGDMCVYNVTVSPGLHTFRKYPDCGTYMLMTYVSNNLVRYSHVISFNTQRITCQTCNDEYDVIGDDDCKGTKQEQPLQQATTPPDSCPEDEFQCSDTQCILRRLVCDRFADCENAMDERFCDNTEGWAQAGTYGKQFVHAWPDSPAGRLFSLSVMSVSNNTTSITIEIPRTNIVTNKTLDPFRSFATTINQSLVSMGGREIDDVTVRVRADHDVSVMAVTKCRNDMNVFQVLPVVSLGKEYYVPLVTATLPGIATVSATSVATNVTVTFSRNVTLNGEFVGNGTNVTKTLAPYQTYQINVSTLEDDNEEEKLVIMHVRANKSVSVISGSVCGRMPTDRVRSTCDYMVEQFPPFDQWGRNFTVPSFINRENFSLLVIAGRGNTSVKMTSVDDFTLNSGNHFLRTFLSDDDHVEAVQSDKPILVVLFSTSWVIGEMQQGDVSMSVIPPHEQFVHGQQRFFVRKTGGNMVHHLAVTAACESINEFLIDDRPISDVTVNQTRVPGGDMCVSHVAVNEPGLHTFTNSHDANTYMLMTYGFDVRIGYSHIVSFNTQQITCQVHDEEHDVITEYACKDVKQDFCPESMTKDEDGSLIVWPKTRLFKTTYPLNQSQICGFAFAKAGSQAWSRQCKLTEEMKVVWMDPVNNCGERRKVETPQDLKTTDVTEGNVEDVSSALQNVTKEIEEISSNDIQAVADTLARVVKANSTSRTVTESVVGTVSAVMTDLSNVDEDDEQFNNIDATTSTSEIVMAVEDQIERVLQEKDNFTVTGDVIQVQGFHVDVGDDEPEDVTIKPVEQKEEDAFTSVVLPKEIFEVSEKSVAVSFILYRDDALFRPRGQKGKEMIGPDLVISVSVMTSVKVEKLEQPVRLNFPRAKNNKTISNSTSCVYWDFGVGDWSTRGCMYAGFNDESVHCECNHLTNFAVLMDYMDAVDGMSQPYGIFLDVLTKIGCVVSIIGLLVTLTIFYFFKLPTAWAENQTRLRTSRPRRILVHLCIALLCLYVTFLFGIDAAARSRWACPMVAALLHYFLLCSMFWMGVEAMHIYRMLVRVFNLNINRFVVKGAIVAWGCPLLIVTICLAAGTQQYTNNGFCFLRQGTVFFFGLLAPIAVILIHNIVIFLLVFRNLLSANMAGTVHGKKTDMDMLKERLQNAMTMTVLMGLTWSFGFLMIGHTTFIFQLLFCLFNSFQGLLVFVLFCWRQEDVRKVLTPHCISFKRKGKEVIGTKADYDVTSTMTGHHSAVIVSTETRKNVTSTGSTSSTALLSPTRTKGNNNLKDSESFV